jgi:hypothetical protein
MQNALTVNGQYLPVREFKGQRVVTIREVAKVHDQKPDVIRRNFTNNRKHFKEGIDYYFLRGSNLAQVNFTRPKVTNLNVFTESGYLMLVKSLTDDLSWQIQRELVNRYFKSVQNSKLTNMVPVEIVIRLLSPSLQKLLSYRIDHKLTQSEAGKLMGISQDKVSRIEQRLQQVGIYVPTQIGKRPSYKNILEVM